LCIFYFCSKFIQAGKAQGKKVSDKNSQGRFWYEYAESSTKEVLLEMSNVQHLSDLDDSMP